ncbi:MAG: hypothetical protein DWH87_01335 [Planctomycetota bacterium]|nr:MAG: hypothetical protein DWH87_01335 [Planctomycetota bacterium]
MNRVIRPVAASVSSRREVIVVVAMSTVAAPEVPLELVSWHGRQVSGAAGKVSRWRGKAARIRRQLG